MPCKSAFLQENLSKNAKHVQIQVLAVELGAYRLYLERQGDVVL